MVVIDELEHKQPDLWLDIFNPHPFRAVIGRQVAGKVCPGCISENIRCRKFLIGRDIG